MSTAEALLKLAKAQAALEDGWRASELDEERGQGYASYRYVAGEWKVAARRCPTYTDALAAAADICGLSPSDEMQKAIDALTVLEQVGFEHLTKEEGGYTARIHTAAHPKGHTHRRSDLWRLIAAVAVYLHKTEEAPNDGK